MKRLQSLRNPISPEENSSLYRRLRRGGFTPEECKKHLANLKQEVINSREKIKDEHNKKCDEWEKDKFQREFRKLTASAKSPGRRKV